MDTAELLVSRKAKGTPDINQVFFVDTHRWRKYNCGPQLNHHHHSGGRSGYLSPQANDSSAVSLISFCVDDMM